MSAVFSSERLISIILCEVCDHHFKEEGLGEKEIASERSYRFLRLVFLLWFSLVFWL